MKILDTQAMREVDRAAIEDIGIPSLVLMENAAIGLVDAICESYPDATSAAIFCGPGNNGGDGLALARHLTVRGYQVEVSLVTPGAGLRGDARVQFDICRNQGLTLREYGPGESMGQAIESASRLDLIVDALFGTGLTRPLTGHYAEVVGAINALPVPCVAVDLPSGLNGSSAALMGPHIQSELTVTFAAPKIAHVFPPAAEAVGEVAIADLGIPTDLIDRADGDLHLLTDELLAGHLSPRPPASHKGDYGHAVIMAGSVGKAGAAILAARAAVRSGAGLVTVAAPEPVAQTVDLGSLESMTLPIRIGEGGGLSKQSVDELLVFAGDKQVLAVGPGLGMDPSTVQVVRTVVTRAEIPVVVDADGLNAFAGATEMLAEGGEDRVLTPHPGELARLLGTTTEEIQGDRLASARAAAIQTRSLVVLKGHRTLIAEPGGTVFVNPTGNAGMATGGTGDVLTGMLTGLLCQGLDVTTAACLAVYLHGLSGDLAVVENGHAGLTASDLLRHLPAAWRRIRP